VLSKHQRRQVCVPIQCICVYVPEAQHLVWDIWRLMMQRKCRNCGYGNFWKVSALNEIYKVLRCSAHCALCTAQGVFYLGSVPRHLAKKNRDFFGGMTLDVSTCVSTSLTATRITALHQVTYNVIPNISMRCIYVTKHQLPLYNFKF
jgi:hypothetical protein